MTKKIVVATSNPGKLHEFTALFQQHGLTNAELVSLAAYPDYQSPVEDAPSFIGNALIKAYHAAATTGCAALADDSGICVDYLQGAPGIYSARFASMHDFKRDGVTKDQLNYLCLLDVLKDVPTEQRTVYFYCCLVLVRFPNDPTPLIAVAKCHGTLLDHPEGKHGHGYDPIFYSTDLDKSFGLATTAEKNTVSHRTRSFSELLSAGLVDFINS